MPCLPFANLGAVALRRAVLVLGLIALLIPVTVVAPSAGKAGAAPTPMPTCAWARKYGVTATNLYWPDSSAVYWSTIYPVAEDLLITVSGVFPDSRYMSFNVYDDKPAEFAYNNMSSSLPDYKIKPDTPGGNPWRSLGETGDRFTVTVRPDAESGQINTLPLAPAGAPVGSKASLIFRVYLPTGGESTIELPTITLTQNGVSTTLPRCEPNNGPASGASGAGQTLASGGDAASVPAGEKVFTRTSEVSNLAPNADNGYLGAWITPPAPGEVVLIRGRAPRAVPGTHPTPWPRLLTDVRYWSMCTNLGGAAKPLVVNRLADGRVHYGCRYNDETKVDHLGYYTYVLGTEDQRGAIEAMDKVTFLPFSVSQFNAPHMVLMRHLLPTPTFPHAIQSVPIDSAPEVAAEVMGAYYPLVTTCSLESLTIRGPARCKQDRG
jgi:hypothetical protein